MEKQLRLISFFSGYDSQSLALKYLGIDFEHWKTCEWAVKSIQALKDLHFANDTTDYSKDLDRDRLVKYLSDKGISSNYNEPMSFEQINRLDESKLRQIYNNIRATHNLVNIQQVKGEDLEITDTDKYDYLLTYSYPCQDLSLAGLGKGMEEGSGTRSSMLWEVKRILAECKELGALPKYLLLENVPQAHGTGNLKSFNDWCNFLKSIGYTNTWTDLNAKNYGIPQNRERCFMVSELDADGVYFKFPEKMKLALRLKDMLEEKVDEKYYLSDKIVSKLAFDKTAPVDEKSGVDLCDTKSEFRDISNTIKSRYDCGYEHFSPGPTGVIEPQLDVLARTENGNNFNAVYSDNGISPTLLARDYKDPVRVAELKQVAQMYPDSGNPQAGRVYDKDGLSPCLDTCQGGNREVKIVEDNYVGMYNYALSDTFMGDKDRFQEGKDIAGALLTTPKEGVVLNEPRICASRGRNPENPNSRESGQHTEQRIELGPDGLSNTLTTVQKDNYVLEPQLEYNGLYKVDEEKSSSSKDNLVVKEDVSEDNLKRQLCNKLIEENKVKEGDIIRHSYTNSRFDSFHIENEENHDCCSTLTTRPDCIGYVENQEQKPCPTLDTRCDCLGVVVNENFPLIDCKNLFLTIFDLCSIITIEESDKYERSRNLLSILWEEISKKEVQEQIRRLWCFQKTKVLQQSLYENGLYENRSTQSSLPNSTPNSSKYNEYNSTTKSLFNMWKNWEIGYTPQRWELPEQQFRKFNLLMQKLSHETTSQETNVQDLWEANERLRLLQQTLFKIQEIWKPSIHKKQNLRIRKLTPREAFRLMGVKDKDFEKIAQNQSNASLYHLAGDSIVTTCLMAIFGKLFNVKYREKVKELLKDINPNFDWDSIEPEIIHEKANIFDDLFD